MNDVKSLSETVGWKTLWDYHHAVGRATRYIVRSLAREDFNKPVHLVRLQRIVDQGAVPDIGLVDYWRWREVAGLFMMPPTCHTIMHWNEARELIFHLRTLN